MTAPVLTRADVEHAIESYLKGRHENRDHTDNTLLPRKLNTPGPTSGKGYSLQTLANGQAAWLPNTTNTLVDAKGDLLIGTADDTLGRLPSSTDTYVLTEDATQATGAKWAPQDGVTAWTTITENTATYGAGIAHQWTGMFGNGVAGTAGDIANRSNPMGFLLTDADYAAPAGRTLQYRIAAVLWVNAATPSVNVALGVTFINALGGGVGTIAPTFAGSWIGNQASIVNPLAGNSYSAFSATWGTGGFNNNVYMFGWLNSGGGGSTLANSLMDARVQLQYRHV